MDFHDLPRVNCIETVTSVRDIHYDRTSLNSTKPRARGVTYQLVKDDPLEIPSDTTETTDCTISLHNGNGPCRFLALKCHHVHGHLRPRVDKIHTDNFSHIQLFDEITKVNGRPTNTATTIQELKDLFTLYMETGNFDGNIITLSVRRPMIDGEGNNLFRDIDIHIVILAQFRKTSSLVTVSSGRFSRASSLGSFHRRILWISKENLAERQEVVFKTRSRMYQQEFLTVRNGKLTTEPLHREATKADYVFTIQHMEACYRRSRPTMMAKVVSCCAIRWHSHHIQCVVDSPDKAFLDLMQMMPGEEDEVSWEKDDPRIFKHRAVSGGHAFECLHYKNFFMSYRPCLDDVTLNFFRGRPTRRSRVEVLRNAAYLATFDVLPAKVLQDSDFDSDEQTNAVVNTQIPDIEEKDTQNVIHSFSIHTLFWKYCWQCCCFNKRPSKETEKQNGVMANH